MSDVNAFLKRYCVMARLCSLIIMAAFFLSSCGDTNPFQASQELTQVSDIDKTPESIETVNLPAEEDEEIFEKTNFRTLTIWVPPQFDPNNGTKTGKLFKDRLETFSIQNPGVDVVVRVKEVSGESGLMQSLSTTKATAPSALPSLIALTRADLEIAALKGFIYHTEEMSRLIDNPDWFFYAKQLSIVEGSAFGLPFAGDGLVLVYRPSKVGITPSDWDTIISRGLPLAFPAGDPLSLLTLSLYQSLGGEVHDEESRPKLEADRLRTVLDLYGLGALKGTFPAWLVQYQSDRQAWQAYKDGKTDFLVTWSSFFLSELPPDSLIVPLPPLGGQEYTLADGWLWAVSEPLPENRQFAVKLAGYLIETDFLADWTSSNGYLPPRPSALEEWTNQSLQVFLNQISRSAQSYPDISILNSIGPVLRDVTIQMISQNDTDASRAAQSAVDRLAVPDIR